MGGLDDYSILKSIGKGSYGEVHLIQHKREKKQYVIKKLVVRKASKRERKAAELEAKLLSKLKHPNIISYKESFESDDGFLYIVMGYAEGGDLYTKLREHRDTDDYLTEVQVVRWFIQICMALQYLHHQHILHRDLKTQNIFLTKTKMIKVGDLGIARVLEGASDMATTLIGTPYYMSPELFSNKPYNYKSDVWALGCCVYEMTTLKHAFNAKDMNSLVYKILKKKMPKMPDMYSNELCDLIRSMLHQNADKRPSVNKILRNPFIKQHIQLFLDESSKSRRPTSGKTRKTHSESSARKPSVSSSRCSSRESNNSVFEQEPKVNIPEPKVNIPEPKVITPQPKVAIPEPKAKEAIVAKPAPGLNAASQDHTDVHNYGKEGDSRAKHCDENNQHIVGGRRAPSPMERRPTPPNEPPPKSYENHRVKSAESSSSTESNDKNPASRPLPEVKLTPPTSASKEPVDLGSSTSSIVSTSSTRTSSSARERRRARKREKSKSSPSVGGTTTQQAEPTPAQQPDVQEAPKSAVEKFSASEEQKNVRKSSSGEELNQFYTLLHTTLRLADDQSPPITPTNQEEADGDNRLSPVPELSESQLSNKEPPPQQQGDGFARNTPQATPIDLRLPSNIQPNVRAVSQATLGSTNKLMKRIVMLRKDCIKGLGVPLLHRAYELLDQQHDEDRLKNELVDLLGEVRFHQWAGKIWQLKFCEESIFQHCGSITAY